MPRRDSGVTRPAPSLYGLQSARGHFRFRATPEPGSEPLRRVWRATYSHDEGWSHFRIVVDLSRNNCTFYRARDADYTGFLRELSEALVGTLIPIEASHKSESLAFEAELIGLKMSRDAGTTAISPTGAFRAGPQGDWLVMRLYLPRSSSSFLIGLNERIGAGEFALSHRETAHGVLQAVFQVFA